METNSHTFIRHNNQKFKNKLLQRYVYVLLDIFHNIKTLIMYVIKM